MGQRDLYSRVWHYWLSLVFLACGWNLATIVYRVAFDVEFEGTALTIDRWADAIFILDILFRLSLPIRKKLRSAQAPHQANFRVNFLDFIATIPWELVASTVGFGFFGASPSYSMLRTPRLLRTFHMFKLMTPWAKSLNIHPGYQRIIKFVALLAAVVHVTGSAFFYLAYQQNVFAGTWVMEQGLLGEAARTQYLYSVYWVVTTMTTVGYGDITPVTNVEIIFSMFVQLMGAFMYSFIIGNLVSSLSDIDAQSAQQRRRLALVESCMDHSKMPVQLRTDIRNFYEFSWERQEATSNLEAFSDLPESLRTSVFMHSYRHLIEKVPLFKGVDKEFIQSIAMKLKQKVYAPGDFVTKKGAKGEEMFFLIEGRVDVLSEEQKAFNTLESGSFFGEIALLYSQTRTATLQAKTWCEFLVLTKEDFHLLLDEYPHFTEACNRNAREMYCPEERGNGASDYKPSAWNPVDMNQKTESADDNQESKS